MDHNQFFKHDLRLISGALDIINLKHQGKGLEIIHKLCIDNMIEGPDLIVAIRNICNGAPLAFRLRAEILPDPLAMCTIKLRKANPIRDECLEVRYVFFFPSGFPVLMESASHASMICTLTEPGSLFFIAFVHSTSWPVSGDFISFQAMIM